MNDTTTRPATVASSALAVTHVLGGVSALWLGSILHEHTPVPPEVDRSLLLSAFAAALLAVLWVWSAVACARRRVSPILLAAAAITGVLVVRAVLHATIWSSEVDVLELVRPVVELVLVAVVLAWRPRGDARDLGGVAPASSRG